MTTLQLKKLLIHQISEINDEVFLNALKTIIDLKSKSTVLELSAKQKEEVYQSQLEIKNGLYVAESDLNEEFESWREKKQSGQIQPKLNYLRFLISINPEIKALNTQ